MTVSSADTTWSKILEILEEKQQYAFLLQAESIVSTKVEGNDLLLTVASEEAKDFFNSEVNQHRLILLCRTVINLETIKAIYLDPSSES